MAEIRQLENRHDISFLPWAVHVDCGDMVESKPEVEFQYGGRLGEFNGTSSQSDVPHCRVLPPGEFNVMIQSHIENRSSPYFIFCFPYAFWASAYDGFRIVSDTRAIIITS